MARPRKGPWRRGGKGPWYTTVGRRIERVADPDDNYEQAYKKYVEFLATEVDADERPSQLTVRVLFRRFLEWAEVERSEGTHAFYRRYLTSFQTFVGRKKVMALTPYHVERWLRGYPTAMADLFGRRFVAVNETDDKACLSEARVKNITGGDKIKARRMREDFWEFTPSHSPMLSTNYRPIIRGTDNGIWRRVYLIPFDTIIDKEKQDRELPAKLRDEWPSILHWAVQGCLAWQREGLNPPEGITTATDEYAKTMDTLGLFLEQECVIGDKCEIKASAFYLAYAVWAQNNREEVLTGTAFGRKMAKRFERDERNDANYYIGVKLAG